MLPPDICVIGGNLNLPDWKVWDFLKDERYLARNAAITAHCAAFLAMNYISTTLPDTPTLVIGWGRIGKCLAALLKSMGCPVSVATGSRTNEAMLQALGYCTKNTANLDLKDISLLINTAPVPVLSEAQLAPYPSLIKLDLASKPGLAGEDVISARGLPGKYAPESSGRLIANTILRFLKEETK
jgi:dipicolinate synthase subunit A